MVLSRVLRSFVMSVIYAQDEIGDSNKGSGGVETIIALKQE